MNEFISSKIVLRKERKYLEISATSSFASNKKGPEYIWVRDTTHPRRKGANGTFIVDARNI